MCGLETQVTSLKLIEMNKFREYFCTLYFRIYRSDKDKVKRKGRVQRSRELTKGRKEHKKPKGVYCKSESLEEMMARWREEGKHLK